MPSPHTDQSGPPLRSVPLWMTACAMPSTAPRKKTFEDLVAEAEHSDSATPDEKRKEVNR